MERAKALELMKQFEMINSYVSPTEKVDSGAKGKLFEMLVKFYLNGRIATKNGVTANNGKGYDLTHKGHKIEVKSGCGQLDNITKSEYVIYSPTSELENARIFKVNDFMNILASINLIRTKKATNGKMVTSIQSFKNSKSKTAKFYQLLETYGTKI